MAITKSAKKALRSSARKAAHNMMHKDRVKNITKKVKKLAAEGSIKEAQALISEAQKLIDKAVKVNFLAKNAGARAKSRLTIFVNKAAASKKK
jgi:small subunit ribosomal protein S20